MSLQQLGTIFVTALGLSLWSQVAGSALQSSPDGLWEPVTDSAGVDFEPLAAAGDFVRPQTYRMFRLDAEAALARLRSVRENLDADSPHISFPKPDGTFVTFRVQQTQTMSPALAEQNPHIKTYRGIGVDDASATVRFERVGETLNAMLLSAEGRSFVIPVRQLGTIRYLAFARRIAAQGEVSQTPQKSICLLDQDSAKAGRDRKGELAVSARRDPVTPGSILRTYRLAVAATAEYATRMGGADAALAAIVSTINRVNEVYESEVAIRFELVARQRELIQTGEEANRYSNEDPVELAQQNQAKIDELIGSSAYDIGHVFGTGPGGYAPGLACQSATKAMASTGRADPIGDPFAIDYVAHEFGHQLSAGHTFNTSRGCSGRFASTAYEPGSGSTIMAYAGICETENIELNTSPYFHAASLDEIFRYVHMGSGATCGTATKTANRAPLVQPSRRAVAIPHSTPFVLTGTATDADGDALTFTWEQMDLGSSAPPNHDADGQQRPLFRSLPPARDATRIFPAIEHIGAVAPVLGDTLPAIERKLRFRLTARDARTGGGAFGWAETHVSVTASGPFHVTRPATATTWIVGSRQVVEWDPADTDKHPISVAAVRIALSTDGGATFSTELRKSVPNNGRATIEVPPLPTTRGRIRVEAIGNVFFNVSVGDITIRQ